MVRAKFFVEKHWRWPSFSLCVPFIAIRKRCRRRSVWASRYRGTYHHGFRFPGNKKKNQYLHLYYLLRYGGSAWAGLPNVDLQLAWVCSATSVVIAAIV